LKFDIVYEDEQDYIRLVVETQPTLIATDDGSILFFGNASRDIDLAVPQLVCPPKVGDFYIFGAHQQHAVYPYRCAEGQKDVERRSISFNAIFQSKTDYDKEKKLETPQAVVRPGETQST